MRHFPSIMSNYVKLLFLPLTRLLQHLSIHSSSSWFSRFIASISHVPSLNWSVAIPNVQERQQSEHPLGCWLWLEGLAHAEWHCLFWTAMRRQLISKSHTCILSELFWRLISCALAFSHEHKHTLSHMKKVREGCMLDQTDSFGLGKKDSSYLKTAFSVN